MVRFGDSRDIEPKVAAPEAQAMWAGEAVE